MTSTVIKEMRQEVKKYVDHADDKMIRVLYAITAAGQGKDWWDELPKKVQAEIEEAMIELDNGGGMLHDEVMKKYSKWFTR